MGSVSDKTAKRAKNCFLRVALFYIWAGVWFWKSCDSPKNLDGELLFFPIRIHFGIFYAYPSSGVRNSMAWGCPFNGGSNRPAVCWPWTSKVKSDKVMTCQPEAHQQAGSEFPCSWSLCHNFGFPIVSWWRWNWNCHEIRFIDQTWQWKTPPSVDDFPMKNLDLWGIHKITCTTFDYQRVWLCRLTPLRPP